MLVELEVVAVVRALGIDRREAAVGTVVLMRLDLMVIALLLLSAILILHVSSFVICRRLRDYGRKTGDATGIFPHGANFLPSHWFGSEAGRSIWNAPHR
jgi:hypothetical protein